MRTIDLVIPVIKPSNIAWWHSSWTGRLILAALLMATAALVLMPDRTNATTHLDHDVICKSVTDGGAIQDSMSKINPNAALNTNVGLIADCKALLAAAEELKDPGGKVNWIQVTQANLLKVQMHNWHGVTVAEDKSVTPNKPHRVIKVGPLNYQKVALPGKGLGGSLTADWAKLDELKTLDLSRNNLSGAVPRSLWEHFQASDGLYLNLSHNPLLKPSPPLELKADVTKVSGTETKVALTWEHTEWYTLFDGVDPKEEQPDVTHLYQYKCSACSNTGWQGATAVTYEEGDVPLDTDAGDATDGKGTRAKLDVIGLAPAKTYTFEVRARKSTVGKGSVESDSSRIDVVGPQTLNVGTTFSLTVAVAYSSATSDDIATLPHPTVGATTLTFNPLAETETDSPVTVTLVSPATGAGSTSVSHTFPVEIGPASTTITETIPNLKLTRQRSKLVDLSKYFSDGAELTEAVSSKTAIATATIVEDKLAVKITARRAGVTTVTVTADGETKNFKVTVSASNNAPQLIGNIPDQTLYLDDQGTQVDMSQFFRDQDNEFLRFIPQSSSPMVVTATVAGSSVIFKVTGLGEARMTIIAQDGAGETAFGSFTVMVLDPNAAPRTVGAIPPQTVRLEDPGLEIDAAPYFRDADGDPLTFTARSADAAILTVEVEESVVTMTAAALGETTVTVTATDPGGKSATQTVVVVVLPANNAPEVVEQIPDQTLQDDDEPLELDVTGYFIDPDGDELSYEGEGTDDSVAEVSVSSAGVALIAPKELSPGELGEVEVTVTASDPLGESVSQTFMVMVQGNLPPEAVGSIEDQVALEGRDILVEVAEYFSDPNGDELTYTAASSNPNAAQAVTIEGSQQLVIRALAPAENVTVTVTAMDPDGESAAQIITVTVAAAPAPATATPEPTAAPEPTATPMATATPAPTSTPVPTDDGGGFPVVLVIVLLLVLGGVGAAVFIIQRRR